MSDRITRLIRTWVPVATGAVFTWLGQTLGLWLGGEAEVAVTAAVTGVVTGVWYSLVTALATHWPWLEVVLGARRPPTYAKPAKS